MADRPQRACHHAGCRGLSETGWCAAHAGEKVEHLKTRDRYRGSPASRGYDHAWTKVREHVLQRDRYLCQRCLGLNRFTLATSVHHILKLITHPHLRLDPDNLVSCCRPCHEELEIIAI
jgi:5-methylcytosine-specific restriction enzyme A